MTQDAPGSLLRGHGVCCLRELMTSQGARCVLLEGANDFAYFCYFNVGMHILLYQLGA